jgi:hypothetical protein
VIKAVLIGKKCPHTKDNWEMNDYEQMLRILDTGKKGGVE